ncbi:hypothetical protein ABID19_002117 [Mesorhizobium robiniae]|uniref:DUF378 domain-containing protein n=1 Tax=Mesorhizobium robiniae TaxID=559315 RepID=A0ABV2GLP5_9HYPH
MTRLIKNLLALIVIAIGALWSLQGIGLIGGSFMTGQSQWLYIGIVTALVGWWDWPGRTRAAEPTRAECLVAGSDEIARRRSL